MCKRHHGFRICAKATRSECFVFFGMQEVNRRSISVVEEYVLADLYPNNQYYIWLAAKSRRGEGASTPPMLVSTQEYGK